MQSFRGSEALALDYVDSSSALCAADRGGIGDNSPYGSGAGQFTSESVRALFGLRRSVRPVPADDTTDDLDLRHAADDAALEPWVLLKAVRDASGRVVDFIYHDINRIAARQQRLQRL